MRELDASICAMDSSARSRAPGMSRCILYSSAYPWMAANGVRSSWLASETNRFILSVVSCCSWKLRSIRASMAFNDADSEPISVFSGMAGMRCFRSPAAILAAVFSMRLSGASVPCTTSMPSTPPSRTTAVPTMMQYRVRLDMVSMESPSGSPMKTMLTKLSFCMTRIATTRQGARAVDSVERLGISPLRWTMAEVVNGSPNTTSPMVPLAGRIGSDTTPSAMVGFSGVVRMLASVSLICRK